MLWPGRFTITVCRALWLYAGRGQNDPECSSHGGFAIEFNAAAVRFHGPLRDRQSQASTTRFAPSRLVYSIESIEYSTLIFQWNSRALILDLDDNLAGITISNEHGDGFPNRRIFHRVVDYVDQRLPEKNAVAFDPSMIVALENEVLRFFFHQNLEQSRSLTSQGHHRYNSSMNLDVTGIGTRDREKVIDQRREPVHLLKHASDDVAVFPTRTILLQPDFADAPNHR